MAASDAEKLPDVRPAPPEALRHVAASEEKLKENEKNAARRTAMKLEGEALLVRIFVGESDRFDGRPLYEAIVFKARELGIAGATVFRGLMGYGAQSRIHTAKVLRLSEDLPMVIEIVDREDRIQQLLPFLDEHVQEGLVTIEKVRVIQYRHSSPPGG
jgi:PII-like signaling protein